MHSFNPFNDFDIDVPDLDELEQRIQETRRYQVLRVGFKSNRRKATVSSSELTIAPTTIDDTLPANHKNERTKLLGIFQKKRTQPYISPRKRATTPNEEERIGSPVTELTNFKALINDDIEDYEEEPPKKRQMLVKQPLGITKFAPPRVITKPNHV
jgi:hypothetical protein